MKVFFHLLLVSLTSSALAQPNLSDERTFLLYEKSLGLVSGGFCSGIIAELDGIHYGITNAHCMKSVEACSKQSLVRNYSHFKGQEALSASNWFEWSDTLVKDGTFINHTCKKLRLVNRHIDLAIFELSEPTNTKLYNKDLDSFSFLNFEDSLKELSFDISILGHPKGGPLEVRNCAKKTDQYRSLNGFWFRHTCNTTAGMSGGGAISVQSGRVLGLNSSGHASEGGGPDLAYLKPYLIEYLRGNIYIGLAGKFKDEYITLDGNLSVNFLEINSKPRHIEFVKELTALYPTIADEVKFPIQIIIDDDKVLRNVENEHPLDYLKVPSDINMESLLNRIRALIQAGEMYQYWGEVKY